MVKAELKVPPLTTMTNSELISRFVMLCNSICAKIIKVMKIINLKNVSKFGKYVYADIQVVILPLMVLGMLHGFCNLIYTIINVWGDP